MYIGVKPPRVAAVLLLPLALTACGGETAAAPSVRPTTSATPLDQSTCPDTGVALWVGEVSAAMGLRSMSVELYNCGERDHVLKGYPQIRLLGADREPIKVAVGHGSSSVATVDSYDRPPRRVTLKPGQVASAGILWRNLVTEDPQRAVTAEYLEIAPLPGRPADRLPGVGIDLGTTRKVGVGPWEKVRQAGTSGPRPGTGQVPGERVPLKPAERLVGELAARKIYPALERLRTQGGFTADSVRAALLGLGFSADTTSAQSVGSSQAVTFAAYPGRNACVSGMLQTTRLTTKVEGVRAEGGCANT
ncbi:DUF4232 domain-containing protein [Actinomadura fulvescens]|uniref:DUF4232 domain-containing protein n=1 Tax=Actinomadura fulvescens TaxID=46160 RepID=A0ABP6CIS0_9ACTN